MVIAELVELLPAGGTDTLLLAPQENTGGPKTTILALAPVCANDVSQSQILRGFWREEKSSPGTVYCPLAG